MATGYLFKDICYPTLAGATSAHWSDTPAAITAGSTSYLVDVSFNGSQWVAKRYTISSSGTLTLNTTTNLPAVAFETCDTQEKFMDGMTIGWGIAVAMVVAVALMQMKRGLP